MGEDETTLDILLEAYDDGRQRCARDLEAFTEPLYAWCEQFVQPRLPADWRVQLDAYLAEQVPKGYRVMPERLPPLVAWIQTLEEYHRWLEARKRPVVQLAEARAEDRQRSGPTIILELPPGYPTRQQIAAAKAWDAFVRERRRAMYEERNRQVREAGRAASEARSSQGTKWPGLTYEERKRAQESTGLPWWYSAALRTRVHSIWEARLERVARPAHDELLRFFRAVAASGRLVMAMAQAEDADFELLAAQATTIQQSYDAYLKARIEFEREWARYLKAVWLIDVEVMALAHKIDAALPIRAKELSSRYDARLRAAIDASRRAGVKALKRAEVTYTTFDWADKVITAVELISLVGSIGAGAKVVFKQAVKKGLSRKAARKAATTYVAVQVTAAAGSMAVAIAVVPSVLAHAGLDEQEVQIGLAAFAAVGVLSSLAARPAARGAAARATRPKAKPEGSNLLPLLENARFYPKFKRVKQDVEIGSTPPKARELTRPIGLNKAQYAELQADIHAAKKMGARDIRVNQHQVNASQVRVGVNRPDLQFTLANGQLVYVEYDTPASPRGLEHLYRTQANDPQGKILLKTIPAEQ